MLELFQTLAEIFADLRPTFEWAIVALFETLLELLEALMEVLWPLMELFEALAEHLSALIELFWALMELFEASMELLVLHLNTSC